MKRILVGILTILICSCGPKPIREIDTDNKTIKVELLCTVENNRIYRIRDLNNQLMCYFSVKDSGVNTIVYPEYNIKNK